MSTRRHHSASSNYSSRSFVRRTHVHGVVNVTFLDRRGIRRLIYAAVIGLALAYFFIVTGVSGRGYQLKKLSNKQTDLIIETRQLDLTIAEESSAQNLKKRVEALGMRGAATVEYAHSDKNSVAVR